jgi:hypothetical protein
MSKIEVDIIVNTRHQQPHYKDTNALILYFLAILSFFFYEANCIANTTIGVSALKAKSKSVDKIKAKQTMILEHILPKPNTFAFEWKY